MIPEAQEPLRDLPDLIPARMLNEFAYCPRLCYIEWVQGEFLDSADTVDGRFQHRRVDLGPVKSSASASKSQKKDSQKNENENELDFETFHDRSVHLSGIECGITCRIDLLEGQGGAVTPIDYKRGYAPDIPEGIYEPERVQLCAQGLVLRENGFACDGGMAYFVKSKKKVPVAFDENLVSRTRELISALRSAAQSSQMPPPLSHSPKCNRCSLAGICLPDEITLLREMQEDEEENAKKADGKNDANGSDSADVVDDMDNMDGQDSAVRVSRDCCPVRRLLPARDDNIPVYVVGQGYTVRKKEDRLEITSRDGKASEARIREISQLCLYGGVEITTPAMVELMQRGIPVIHYTHGGWFQGICLGTTHKNVELRIRQFQCFMDPARSAALARSAVSGKIRNCRTLLRRNCSENCKSDLDLLAKLAVDADRAESSESLQGIEGAAGQCYFSKFSGMLKPGGKSGAKSEDKAADKAGDKAGRNDFSFTDRNRRPPRDPVNAVLSYLYGILVKDLFVVLLAVGFDPYLGFYHRPRYGRPALALDMMEEFRPLIADSTAITLLNNEELSPGDFLKSRAGVTMTANGKKAVVSGYERRMETEIVHPIFGYKISYRRVLEVQARLLARAISGEISQYPPFCTR
ncbi:MAG TPA: CRISPR-associated endonuclease Cas1 [Methanothrix sp.]|nr:CRISPR-associated endonuclease Cas1 [Methanothrix sp.]